MKNAKKTVSLVLCALLCASLLFPIPACAPRAGATAVYDIVPNAETAVTVAAPEERVYFRFTPKETAAYRFFSDAQYDVYAALLDAEMNTIDENDDGGPGHNFRIDAVLTAGETYYFEIFCGDGSTGSFCVKLVKIIDATFTLRAKNGKTAFRAAPGESVTLETEAFSAMGENLRYAWYRGREATDDALLPETSAALTVENVTDTARYYCRAQDEYGSYGEVLFTVYCFTGQTLALNAAAAAQVAAPGARAYFAFTAEETATYRFFSQTDVDVYAAMLDAEMNTIDENDDGGPGHNFRIDAVLTAGETYYFEVFCVTGSTGSFPVKLVKLEPNGFSAKPKDGLYNRRVSPGGTVTLEVEATPGMGPVSFRWFRIPFSGSDETLAETGETLTLENVTASGRYLCRVTDDFGFFEEIEFRVYCFNELPIALNKETAVNITLPGEWVYFSFTPEETRVYRFYSQTDGDVMFELYDADMTLINYDDDSGPGRNFMLKTELKAGETYYFAVFYVNGATGGFPVYLVFPEENGFSAARATDEFTFLHAGDEPPAMEVKAECLEGKLHYRWRNQSAEQWIDGAADPSYTPPAFTKGTVYACTVSDDFGNTAELTFELVNLDAITYDWTADRAFCTAAYADVTPASVEIVSVITETTATCEKEGVTVYTAAFTDPRFQTQTLKEDTPPLGHAYGAPTYEWRRDYGVCTATVVCANDKSHVITETAESEIRKEESFDPTCTEPGQIVYVVGFINKIFYGQTATRVLPPLEHDLVPHEAQAPTCLAVGWEAYETCSRCKYSTYKELPRDPDAHDFKVTVYPPTCTDAGYTSHACRYCRYGFSTDEVPALGHDFSVKIADAEHLAAPATCTDGAKYYYTCSRCDAVSDTLTFISGEPDTENGHNYIPVSVVAPTCETDGYTVYTCAVCGDSVKRDVTERTGHKYGEPVYEWSDDLSECTAMVICANDRSHVIGETAKPWISEELSVAPTCTEPGVTVYLAGFNSKRFYGQKKEVEVPALGHDFSVETADAEHLAAPASCVAQASYYYACSRCGAISQSVTFTSGAPEPQNHSWGEWTVVKEAAPGVPGEERRVCANAPSHVETREIPALPEITVKLGDVDGDGNITAGDARLALRRAVTLETYAEGSREFIACDANRDNAVTAADARMILRAAVGLEDADTW